MWMTEGVGLHAHERLDPVPYSTRARGRCGRGRRASRARRSPFRRRAARRRSRSSSASAPRGGCRRSGRETLRPSTARASRARRRRAGSPRSQEVHVRRGSRRGARGRSRTTRPRVGADQRCETTWKASPAWTYSAIRGDHRLERRAGHVRTELRLRARNARGRGEEGQPRDLADRAARGSGAPAARPRRAGAGEDRDRVAEVVERDDHVRQHQRHVRAARPVRVRSAGARPPRAVVAGEPDERRRRRDRGLPSIRAWRCRETSGAASGMDRCRRPAPARDLARLVADERPAADALALLGRPAGTPGRRPQLQERGDRRLVSSMNVWQTGTRLWSPAAAASTPGCCSWSAATGKQPSSASASSSPRVRSSTPGGRARRRPPRRRARRSPRARRGRSPRPPPAPSPANAGRRAARPCRSPPVLGGPLGDRALEAGSASCVG